MWQLIISIGLALSLTACGTFNGSKSDYSNDILVQPDLPSPVSPIDVEWDVYQHDGKTYIGLPFSEFMDFAINREDTLRYIDQLTNVVCFYRVTLDEPRCQHKNNNNQPTKKQQ